MLNPFGKKPAASGFPKPKWPPIQAFDEIDFWGKKTDGGADLIIVASQPLDDSEPTLQSISAKVDFYLRALGHAPFLAQLDNPPRTQITIVMLCEHPIHTQAMEVIAVQKALAAGQGINLELRRTMGDQPLPIPKASAAALGVPENPVRPLNDEERMRIVSQVEFVQKLLRSRYGNEAQLRRTVDDLLWLQRLHDDGVPRAGEDRELECVGVVFGQVLAAQTPLRWVAVHHRQDRIVAALEFPGTTIAVFPADMIAKRVNRGEHVDFVGLCGGLIDHIQQIRTDPGYRKA